MTRDSSPERNSNEHRSRAPIRRDLKALDSQLLVNLLENPWEYFGTSTQRTAKSGGLLVRSSQNQRPRAGSTGHRLLQVIEDGLTLKAGLGGLVLGPLIGRRYILRRYLRRVLACFGFCKMRDCCGGPTRVPSALPMAYLCLVYNARTPEQIIFSVPSNMDAS